MMGEIEKERGGDRQTGGETDRERKRETCKRDKD